MSEQTALPPCLERTVVKISRSQNCNADFLLNPEVCLRSVIAARFPWPNPWGQNSCRYLHPTEAKYKPDIWSLYVLIFLFVARVLGTKKIRSASLLCYGRCFSRYRCYSFLSSCHYLHTPHWLLLANLHHFAYKPTHFQRGCRVTSTMSNLFGI